METSHLKSSERLLASHFLLLVGIRVPQIPTEVRYILVLFLVACHLFLPIHHKHTELCMELLPLLGQLLVYQIRLCR